MTSARMYVRLVVAYCFLCFSSVATGFMGLFGSHYGYLWAIEKELNQYAHSTNQPMLILLDYALTLLFGPGIFASLLVLLVIMLIVFLLGLLLAAAVKLAEVSVIGALVVYAIVGIILAALLRRHWSAIVEAAAWVLVSVQGLWQFFFPETEPAPAAAAAAASAAAGSGTPFTFEGATLMSRDDDTIQKRPDALPAVNLQLPVKPAGIFNALTHKIKTQMSTQAIQQETEMVRSANQLASQYVTRQDLETEFLTAGDKRETKMASRELEKLQAKAATDDFKTSRHQKANQPANPIERQFETEFKPARAGDINKPLFEAQTSAQTLIQAAAELKKLQKEIDGNPDFSPEEKQALKKQLRAKFNDVLGKEE